jgi:hypothetical protein
MSCRASCNGPQVRGDLLVKIPGQEPQRLARLHRRAGQNDPRHRAGAQVGQRHRYRQVSLPGACRADAEDDVVLADRLDIVLLADGLGRDLRLALRGADALGHESLQRLRAIVLHDVQCVGEIPVADGGPGFEVGFEQLKKLLCPAQTLGLALQAEPAVAAGGLDGQVLLERAEVAVVAVVELLGEAGVLEVQGFSGHGGTDGA